MENKKVRVLVNWKKEHVLQVAELLEKGFRDLGHEIVTADQNPELVVNTLPDNGFIEGTVASVWWDLETAEFRCGHYFDRATHIFYPNHKFVKEYDQWKDKSSFLPLATDPELFNYHKSPFEYDIVFSGREDVNRQIRVEGLNRLQEHCDKKGYKFLRTNGHTRGEENSKVISKGKLTIQIAGLRNLEQRVFENSPIRPQLVDVQEDNEMEMKLIDPKLKSFIPFDYDKGWQDLTDKVDYYLEHMDEAEKIVNYARRYFFKQHTYKNRAQRILEVVGL